MDELWKLRVKPQLVIERYLNHSGLRGTRLTPLKRAS